MIEINNKELFENGNIKFIQNPYTIMGTKCPKENELFYRG